LYLVPTKISDHGICIRYSKGRYLLVVGCESFALTKPRAARMRTIENRRKDFHPVLFFRIPVRIHSISRTIN